MTKKYNLLLSLSIPAVFMIFFGFNGGETKPNLSPTHSRDSRAQIGNSTVNLAADETMAAAILIMPKSYLPALKQFSNSAMAKNITILPAQLESKDGQMTAVYKKNEKGRGGSVRPADTTPAVGRREDTHLETLSEREKRLFVTGMVYLLTNMRKGKIFP